MFGSKIKFLVDEYLAILVSFPIALSTTIGSRSVHAGYLYEAALKPSRISGLHHEVVIILIQLPSPRVLPFRHHSLQSF